MTEKKHLLHLFLEQTNQSSSREKSTVSTKRHSFLEDEMPAAQMLWFMDFVSFEVFQPNTNQAHLAQLMKSDNGTADGNEDAGQ